MASNTPQVSGKVKAGSIAATAASGVVSAFLVFVGAHVPALADLAANPWTVLVLVSAVTGGLTFVTGYLARHLPPELVQDVREAVDTAVSQANIDEAEEQASK